MLPLRLGMVNANGPQELFVYALTRKGRVETTNYRTVRLPSDQDIPLFVKDRFADFYRALFDNAGPARGHGRRSSPSTRGTWAGAIPARPSRSAATSCAGSGVFWLGDGDGGASRSGADVFLTRLHVRYDAAHFPEDLAFQETADRQNFQARYVLHHAYAGTISCDAAGYRLRLRDRREQEARNLDPPDRMERGFRPSGDGPDPRGARDAALVRADLEVTSPKRRLRCADASLRLPPREPPPSLRSGDYSRGELMKGNGSRASTSPGGRGLG